MCAGLLAKKKKSSSYTVRGGFWCLYFSFVLACHVKKKRKVYWVVKKEVDWTGHPSTCPLFWNPLSDYYEFGVSEIYCDFVITGDLFNVLRVFSRDESE